MQVALAVIDKIIEEHETIMREVQTLERVANDTKAIGGLEEIEEAFKPEKLGEKQNLHKLQQLLLTIAQGLQAHFNLEETGLLVAFEKYGDKRLTSAFSTLLLQHENLRNHFARSKKDVADLIGSALSRQVWEIKAHDMQAHISHTRKLLEAHAETEQELLQELRERLQR